MKALSFASILGIVGFTLMISACSDEKNAFNTNECPKDALCLYQSVSFKKNIMPLTLQHITPQAILGLAQFRYIFKAT